MKVFISHTFKKQDKELAQELKRQLTKDDIDGYLAEERQDYVLLIGDKIKEHIASSDYLVAIITEHGLKSASVHEEIGYALGKEISVLLMVKKNLKEEGVLIHGKEIEYFTENFEIHCTKIIKYMQEHGVQNKTTTVSKKSINEFLSKRNLLDPDSVEFAKNADSESLWNEVDERLTPNGIPCIIFSSCPTTTKDRLNANGKKFDKWMEQNKRIKIDGHDMTLFRGEKYHDLDFIRYEYKMHNEKTTYSKFYDSGFFEHGVSLPLIREIQSQSGTRYASLQLGGLTGLLWAFLQFCKLFYTEIEMNERFDVLLSIRNSQDLMLAGFGGSSRDGVCWAEPHSMNWNAEKPRTTISSIQLKLEDLTTTMTDESIKLKTRKISDKISNAYGLQSSFCYNHDGSFPWESVIARYSHI